MRNTQNPLEGLWKVTRSTDPASTSLTGSDEVLVWFGLGTPHQAMGPLSLQDVIDATGRAAHWLIILMVGGDTGDLESAVMHMLLLTMNGKGNTAYSRPD